MNAEPKIQSPRALNDRRTLLRLFAEVMHSALCECNHSEEYEFFESFCEWYYESTQPLPWAEDEHDDYYHKAVKYAHETGMTDKDLQQLIDIWNKAIQVRKRFKFILTMVE